MRSVAVGHGANGRCCYDRQKGEHHLQVTILHGCGTGVSASIDALVAVPIWWMEIK